MKTTPMSTVAVLRMARSDTFMTDEPENISVSDLTRRKKCLDADCSKTIHSGHFMISRVHLNEEDDEEDEEDVALSPSNIKKEGFDFDNAKQETSTDYHFGHNVSIDGSLTKLFQCMTLAYSGKLTSPKFKLFKGLKLMLKDKLRLNNIIWREWHMQFIKSRDPIVCQFSAPLDSDASHGRAEAVVMEGKYWKRRLDTVTLEYKKWRAFFKEKYRKIRYSNKHRKELTATHAELIENMPTIDRLRYAMPPQSPIQPYDEDFMMDFTDTLFSSLNQPFAFPNAREINYMANPDFIQPGLIQLQPNLDDFMDTLEPFQDMIARNSNVVTFTGQDTLNVSDISNTNSILPDELSSASDADLLGNAVDLAETISLDHQSSTLDTWNKNNYAADTVPITYTAYTAPVNKVTIPPGSTFSLVTMTQPPTPVTIQHTVHPQTVPGVDRQFAVPVGKPARSKQRPIAPAPAPVHSPSVVSKNVVSPNNSCLAQLLTSVGSYPGLKTEDSVTPLQKQSVASTPKSHKSSAAGKPQMLAKMLANSPGPVQHQSTVDTVATILGLVEPSGNIMSPVAKPANSPSYSFVPSPQSIASPASSTRSRHDSDPMSPLYESVESFLDNAYTHGSEILDSPEGHKGIRPKTDNERVQYKEQRRALHISAEQKRRVNIKTGFDMLHTLIPALQQNITSKISKAQMLQKTAEYCRKMKSERSTMQDEADLLRQEIETLKDAIGNCQAQLPATGVPVTRQRADQMQEMFEEYIKNRTMQNWKFWIFSRIIRSLFASYNNIVSTASIEDLCRSVLAWLDQNCSLVQLRPDVFNSLRELSTTTSILSNPSRVREEAIAAVTKQERRDSV